MLPLRTYYALKPFLPAPVRLKVRSAWAQRKRRSVSATWPIDPRAGHAPEGWPGWPDGKKFALVFTHDVESALGLERCLDVAALEAEYGFRSSFNFIPEGSYSTPSDLRHELIRRGFEVGVHDLHHDGKLYTSKRAFLHHARRINDHLKAWGAVGFRSGFMLRNLDWITNLDIEYDASTFDTDPFEPQPDGAGTIFPFWVPRSASPLTPHPSRQSDSGISSILNPQSDCSGDVGRSARPSHLSPLTSGYVELPYTLPQDSTLFLMLRETSADTWKRKLDWVAERGGLVLVNTHPDYMHFREDQRTSRTYPATFYRDLLEYARTRYAGQYWSALPREVARYCRETGALKPLSRKRVCMVAYTYYNSDNRVIRYAEALAARGDTVDVLALHRSENEPDHEVINGVNLIRIQKRIGKNEKRKGTYLIRLLRFTIAAFFRLAARQVTRPYDVIHVHNIPDFLVFSALVPKLLGARVILDIHDLVPEFYGNKFKEGEQSAAFRYLQKVERLASRFADHVIISNHLWYERVIRRSVPPEKCSVYINYVDTRLFKPHPRTRTDDRFRIVFPGGLQWHQGLDIAIRAMDLLRTRLPKAELHIYGDGNARQSLLDLITELKLEDRVFMHEPVPIAKVPQLMADADLGIVPKRADSFGNEAYSTKIMEYMSQGVPVILSRTKIDSYYFDTETARFFKSGNVQELANAIVELAGNPTLRERLTRRGLEYVARNNWNLKKADYFALVDGTATSPASSLATKPAPAEVAEALQSNA